MVYKGVKGPPKPCCWSERRINVPIMEAGDEPRGSQARDTNASVWRSLSLSPMVYQSWKAVLGVQTG